MDSHICEGLLQHLPLANPQFKVLYIACLRGEIEYFLRESNHATVAENKIFSPIVAIGQIFLRHGANTQKQYA